VSSAFAVPLAQAYEIDLACAGKSPHREALADEKGGISAFETEAVAMSCPG